MVLGAVFASRSSVQSEFISANNHRALYLSASTCCTRAVYLTFFAIRIVFARLDQLHFSRSRIYTPTHTHRCARHCWVSRYCNPMVSIYHRANADRLRGRTVYNITFFFSWNQPPQWERMRRNGTVNEPNISQWNEQKSKIRDKQMNERENQINNTTR